MRWRGRFGGWKLLAALAWVYLAAIVAFALVVVLVGERWWVGTVALYSPRLPLLLPLVLFAPLAWNGPRRRVFGVQAALMIVVVVLLAGPHLSFARKTPGAPSVRVFSYNVWFGKRGVAAIEREVVAADAGVIAFQATRAPVVDHFRALLGPSWSFQVASEFFLASRYPIASMGTVGPNGGFLACTLDTPLGLVDFYNVHPVSPRPGLNEVGHQSKKRLLTEGPSEESVDTVEANTQKRASQVADLAAAVALSKNPVVIAGDTNLPEWSAMYRAHLGRWQDGFAQAGTGLGYTFPADRAFPWMRIDRVLAGPELRFTAFGVGGREGSDHRPVWADLEKR